MFFVPKREKIFVVKENPYRSLRNMIKNDDFAIRKCVFSSARARRQILKIGSASGTRPQFTRHAT